ncbi:MAG: sigma-70 family RNA polymerase sigma factor [Ignavibacteria bacterium]|nr:sigma-70 family RNA polymerase sigma factor [Ignavibacteria bacterium]
MEIRTDAELINEYVTTKSNAAAKILVEKYRNFVFSVALRYTHSYDDADDLAQEVFIKAFSNLHTFEFKSSLQTWLYRITVNTYLNSKSKRNINNTRQRDSAADLEQVLVENDNPESQYEYSELLDRFNDALQKLPERQREVFSLRYFDEMKYEEISQLLGLTVGGLKANYFHAIKKLAEMLK